MRESRGTPPVAICIALLTLPACSVDEGEPTPSGTGVVAETGGASPGTSSTGVGTDGTGISGTSDATASMGGAPTGSGGTSNMGVGIGGDSSQAGRGGTPAGAGGLGSGGNDTGESGGSGIGGAPTGTGGAVTGGTAGTASDSGGAAGEGGADTGGSGGMGESDDVLRPPVEVAGAVPPEYRSPVANGGEWTPHTYPVYHYTTQTSGLTPDDSVERQPTPIMKPCNVYTPPDYDPEVEYPLVFVLHGITNNENSWMNEGNPKPDVLLDNLITSGDIEPVIAVFPQGDSSEGYASHNDFSQTAGYMVFGDELMNDLIPFIEANYSVKTDRNYRAICGISFGGMQTVNIGLSHHLEDFAWFGSFAAAGGAYGSTQIARALEAQDVAAHPVKHFYAMAGDNDSFGADGTVNMWEQQLPGEAPSLTSENFTAHVISGMHDYPTTTVGLYNFLRVAFGI